LTTEQLSIKEKIAVGLVKEAIVHHWDDNEYKVVTGEGSFLIGYVPSGAKIEKQLVRNVAIRKSPDVLIADPPWSYMSSKPTRGPRIEYDVQSWTKIMQDLQQCWPTKLCCIWTVNKYLEKTLELRDKMGFRTVANVECVKFTNKEWNLFKSLGFYLQHARDTMLMAISKGKKLKDVVNLEKAEGDLLFKLKSLEANRKPKSLHYLLDRCLKDRKQLKCMEIYARPNNVTRGWKHIGQELEENRVSLKAVWVERSRLPKEYIV
jgi:N6-adenosine-specific RNA methylase IME4